jgi:hypothetical protein
MGDRVDSSRTTGRCGDVTGRKRNRSENAEVAQYAYGGVAD